ncbi:hypothetical protein NUV26_31435, partial [Burkholderia pseudomultivorans]|uniref:hypothetical protein n=1 Tax=Burkholderia pseudomultivorans TaxID=1207504 RepID=UPI0028758C51|nr:hypothetical protein [Burkholderia pseudomultivorans]
SCGCESRGSRAARADIDALAAADEADSASRIRVKCHPDADSSAAGADADDAASGIASLSLRSAGRSQPASATPSISAVASAMQR